MKIYLAIPYSYNPRESFDTANLVASQLMTKGHIVFSPISHGHHIADYLPPNLRTDSDWWLKQCLPMIDWADMVYVVVINEVNGYELIRESHGVSMEISEAQKLRKGVIFYHHEKERE